MAAASPCARAPLLRTHFSPVFSIKMQKRSPNKCLTSIPVSLISLLSHLCRFPLFFVSPCVLDVLKPQMLHPNGDTSHFQDCSYVPRLLLLPKGPFRTKNSTASESVVFCYRRSFLLSVPFSCLFSLEEQALLSTHHSVLRLPYRIFSL